MYLDKELEFSDSQAVTASAISTNVIDLGATNTLKDIGAGGDVYLIVRTNVNATDSGSNATLVVSFLSDSTENLATSPTTHITTGSLAFADFATAGTVLIAQKLPPGDYERYAGIGYTVGDGPLTAGQFDAFLTLDYATYRAYADNQPIHANA